MELNRQNVILKTKGTCGYFTVLKDPLTDKIRIYYRSSSPSSPSGPNNWTRFLESDDGIEFVKPDKDIIIGGTGCCHNFFPFLDIKRTPDDPYIYKAIGGTHWRKEDPFWHRRDRHEGMEKNTTSTHGFRGLYKLGSKDGIHWEKISLTPFIDRHHKKFQTRGRRQKREFDSHNCLFYDETKKLYILYVRANVKEGIRHIQYSTSEDLQEWSSFKLIEIEDGFSRKKDNYYFPNFFIHPYASKYIGIIPYANREESALYLMISNDGFKWKKREEWFLQKPWFDDGEEDKPRNKCHPVSGYVFSNNEEEIYFYIHFNYFNHEKRKPVKIRRYSIHRRDFVF